MRTVHAGAVGSTRSAAAANFPLNEPQNIAGVDPLSEANHGTVPGEVFISASERRIDAQDEVLDAGAPQSAEFLLHVG